MTKEDKKQYKEGDAIGVYSFGYTGLIIYDIEYGIEDYIIYKYCDNTDKKYRLRKSKVYITTTGKLYFRYNNRRIYLDDCLRLRGMGY